MDTIFEINGSDAIPVRALPYLTRWEFDAQDVVNALAGDKKYDSFFGLRAYRIDGDFVREVADGEWAGVVAIALENVADDLSTDQWRREMIAALPAGVFVWKEPWANAYNSSPDGPNCLNALDNDPDAYMDKKIRALHFSPNIPADLVQLVAEGFVQPEPVQQVAPAQSAQNTSTSEAVVAAGVSVVTHSTRVRRGTLTPVIEFAQNKCNNPKDTAEVWAVLQVLAEKKYPPLIGATEDGLQYYKNGGAAILSRKSLGQRLAR